MRLLEFFETVNLFEAAIDRYLKSFEGIIRLAKEIDPAKGEAMAQWVNEEVSWALQTLHKDDKIQWYLRFVKIYLLHKIYVHAEMVASERDPTKAQAAQQSERAYHKFARIISNKMGIPEKEVAEYGQQVSYTPGFKRRMEHFMSLELPAIENYVMAWQKPQQIWADWTPIENEWQQKAATTMEIDREGTDTIIKYPDGSEWVNLNRQSCSQEAQAMGHCGNAATPGDNDTVLSYRTIEDTPKGKMWKPRLTFILNTENGLLGEMKGRANQKPNEKYHKVIVDLLKNDIVKGIRGGGYDPGNNFDVSDLPTEVAEELIEKKPGLASVAYDYQRRGMTRGLLNRMEEMYQDEMGEAMPKYDETRKEFLADTDSSNVEEFIEQYGGDTARWVNGVLTGHEFLDSNHDSHDPEDLWNQLPDNVTTAVGVWVIENNPDAVEEWKENNDRDLDPSNARDIWEIIEENDIDEVKQPLTNAMFDGENRGMETEMYEAMKSWIEDLPNASGFSISLEPGYREFDNPQFIAIPERLMVDIISDMLDDVVYNGNLIRWLEIEDLEQPYYGFSGYDEDAAKESAVDKLADEGIKI